MVKKLIYKHFYEVELITLSSGIIHLPKFLLKPIVLFYLDNNEANAC